MQHNEKGKIVFGDIFFLPFYFEKKAELIAWFKQIVPWKT